MSTRHWLVWLFIPVIAGAEPLHMESPEEQVKLLELFTSQGCSSCPPADQWLSGFVDHPDLWQKVIPMAWHVDYWNDLGWPDRFATAAFSQRQRDYHKAGLIASVYTPGFVLQGQEWRGWFRGGTADFRSQARVGRLALEISPGDSVEVSFRPTVPEWDQPLTARLALLGCGLISSIGGGENAGRELTEDFVVLGISSAESATADWSVPWPKVQATDAKRLAVVVWLSARGSPAPIQAAGGWLP
ncbi:MAG: DUF1223 domain-containing protein [Gammaproteobacteria bacterium]|nr:DUF1223 domain-containing protein [Gammaproteobacteria bacterium]